MVGFGRTAGGWSGDSYYRPILADSVYEVNEARTANLNPAMRIPLPVNWDCDIWPCV